MYITHLSRFVPFYRAFDAGSGGGSPAGPGGGPGADAGRGSQVGGGSPGAGGAPGGQAIRLSDDMLIDIGDGKPVKYGDYKNGFVPRSEFEGMTTRYNQGRDYLLSEAKRVEGAWTQLAQVLKSQGHSQAGQGGPQDPLAKFKDLAIVDGNTLSEAYAAMREGDLKPMQTALANQQRVIEQLSAQVRGLGQNVGSHNESSAEQNYQRTLDTAVRGLNIPGLDLSHPELKPHLDFIHEIAEDVFRSHDPNDQNYNREMPGILRNRMEGLLKLAATVSKVKVEQAKAEKRKFLRPGGTASPGQGQKYQFEDGRQIARRFFDSMETGTA